MSHQSNMNEVVRMNRDDLIAALRAKLPAAGEYDQQALAEHRTKCATVGKARRMHLRELASRPLAELGELRRNDFLDNMPSEASCPLSMVTKFEDTISRVQLDSRKVFTIKQQRSDPFWNLLNWGVESLPRTVC
jgi:hypothetical protein